MAWASLPMYPWPQPLTEHYWQWLRQRLQQLGEQALPARLGWPQDYLAHWREPGMLLSQCCGYPVSALLPAQVQVLGAFHYQLPGCADWRYSSALLVRQSDAGLTLADFRGQRAVCNERHSQSGYHALRAAVGALAGVQPFFAQVRFSGSHRASAALLAAGEADIAALDCVSHALLARQQPQLFEQLACIGHTRLQPGLPLITAASTPAVTVARLRQAIGDSLHAPELQPFLQAAAIGGFSPLDLSDYACIADAAAHWRAAGMAEW
ncbi:phosphate/phosphite/phosphonate ABC transporter substrate-binding protein [Aquitalea magnusonii]|uniref:Phosphonate ABC transporter substrate-binding protein n=1 Tax=Aquitalea magnusonii TaxID=332411 RepID=A0A318J085_9NEIS|nr:PhnD/SsuA/transferrin family substrate-binding protein [Aquitalea magnusonii]PXX40071.1 phosphonate ABC transporter substrate-binding protein [Aquitalea magnusonii]